MRKVHEKLSQISTLATNKMTAEPLPKQRRDGSPTSTNSSTSTLKDDGSIECLPSLVNENGSKPPQAVKMSPIEKNHSLSSMEEPKYRPQSEVKPISSARMGDISSSSEKPISSASKMSDISSSSAADKGVKVEMELSTDKPSLAKEGTFKNSAASNVKVGSVHDADKKDELKTEVEGVTSANAEAVDGGKTSSSLHTSHETGKPRSETTDAQKISAPKTDFATSTFISDSSSKLSSRDIGIGKDKYKGTLTEEGGSYYSRHSSRTSSLESETEKFTSRSTEILEKANKMSASVSTSRSSSRTGSRNGSLEGKDFKVDASRTTVNSISHSSSRTDSRNGSLEGKDFKIDDYKSKSKSSIENVKVKSTFEVPKGTKDYLSKSATLDRYTTRTASITTSTAGTTSPSRDGRKDVDKFASTKDTTSPSRDARKEVDKFAGTTGTTSPSRDSRKDVDRFDYSSKYKSATLYTRRDYSSSRSVSKAFNDSDSSDKKKEEDATPVTYKSNMDGIQTPSSPTSKISKSDETQEDSKSSDNLMKSIGGKHKFKHRPTTPIQDPHAVTGAKLQRSPERHTRRKSEGMKPIPHMLVVGDVSKSETIEEEEEEQRGPDEGEIPPAPSSSKVVDRDVSKVTEPSTESVSDKDAPQIEKDLSEKEKDNAKINSSVKNGSISKPVSKKSSSSDDPEVLKQSSTTSSPVQGSFKSNTSEMVSSPHETARPSSRSGRQSVSESKDHTKVSTPYETSRPSSRSGRQSASESKDQTKVSNTAKTTKPLSPTQKSKTLTSSRYSSSTCSVFTIGENSPFMKAEPLPVLKPTNSDASKKAITSASRSLSSLTSSPIDKAWKEESNPTTLTSSSVRGTAPVRGGTWDSRRSTGMSLSSSPTQNEEISSHKKRTTDFNEDNKRAVSPIVRKDVQSASSPGSASPTKIYPTSSYERASGDRLRKFGFNDEESKSGKDGVQVKTLSSREDYTNRITIPVRSQSEKGSPSRRKFVQREKPILDKVDSVTSPSIENADKPSHSIIDLAGPKIIVRTPSTSGGGVQSTTLKKPTEVQIRERSPTSNRKKQKSWRETPVIPDEIVKAILTGEIFDEEEACENPMYGGKLETCEEKEEEPIKKFSPGSSRSGSRVGQHTPTHLSPPSSSPDHSHSPSSVTVKKLSFDSVDQLSLSGEEKRPRRKFLSAGDHSATFTSSYSSENTNMSDDRDDNLTPDPLSASMDMRQNTLSRLRTSSLSHSCSTPDLTEITGKAKKGAKAKRVERSNSRRLLGRSRVDAYIGSSPNDGSPSRRSGVGLMSPRHSSVSFSSRLLSGSSISRAFAPFRRSSEKETRNQGSRTLK